MGTGRSATVWISLGLFTFAAVSTATVDGQSAASRPAQSGVRQSAAAPVASAAPQRALIDQYCVTCHNDRTKTANLSLQQLDLTTVGDHPELWEKVVRKLRAGVMPPPDVKRPPLADYEDRKSTRLNSSHVAISYAVFCLKKKKDKRTSAN